MYNLRRGGGRRAVNIWPGFVDALATLLLVIIFVLLVFVVAQFYLSTALSGREQALKRLQSEILELTEMLSLERSANADLRVNVAQLSSELQSSLKARDSLTNQLAALAGERDELRGKLQASEQRIVILDAETAKLQDQNRDLQADIDARIAISAELSQKLEDAYKTIEADREKIEVQITELATLRELRDSLRQEVAGLQATLESRQAATEELRQELEQAYAAIDASERKVSLQVEELAILRDLRDQLQREVAALDAKIEAARTAQEDADRDLETLRDQLVSTTSALGRQVEMTEEAKAQIRLMNQQLAALRRQLASLNAALEASEALNREQEVQIVDLGQRLNAALATKVQELARYRSEFFGRLREALGDRPDIRIVGDRFVLQSEVLFNTAEAEIGEDGRAQLHQLAETLKEIAAQIPADLEWILRVDGHTDRRPIATPEFPSNWELSTARALSVVKFLVAEGIAPERLAATGFGPYQPLATGDNELALSRNRRIEFKLTER
ncbi:peptidoglycan -binding protein [Limibacillus sp. MBR-115]|jgi:chemotaxis protein MotB|uniref:peptidoglycan -binding protein n=1 Tax=Limibacillus sp. MBR-115 TaxID=3156465 RepID=UPI0033948F15